MSSWASGKTSWSEEAAIKAEFVSSLQETYNSSWGTRAFDTVLGLASPSPSVVEAAPPASHAVAASPASPVVVPPASPVVLDPPSA